MGGMHECKGMCKQWMHGAWLPFIIFSIVLWGLLVFTQKQLTRPMELENLGSSGAYTSAYLNRVEEAVKSTVTGKAETKKAALSNKHAYTTMTDASFLDHLDGFEIFLIMLDAFVAAFWFGFIRQIRCGMCIPCSKTKESCSKSEMPSA
jgi:hypothetical protein